MVKRIMSIVYCSIILLFIYAPILLLVVFSFIDSNQIGQWGNFSFSLYVKMFRDAAIMKMLFNTVWLALAAATLSTILGTFAAIGIFYNKKRLSAIYQGVSQIPVVNAEIVTAISLALLFSGISSLIPGASLYRTYFSLLIGHMVLCTPFVILSVMPKLKQMDGNLYEAALDLGATPAQALFKVVLPQIFSGVVSGFMLSITLSLDDYIITCFSKPRSFETISTYVYDAVKNSTNSSSPALRALSAMIFIIMLIALIIINFKSNKVSEAKK